MYYKFFILLVIILSYVPVPAEQPAQNSHENFCYRHKSRGVARCMQIKKPDHSSGTVLCAGRTPEELTADSEWQRITGADCLPVKSDSVVPKGPGDKKTLRP
ncbi:exported hypothetical protein [Candidatus Magnetomoraceae bacterium gMMP-1]